jgi:outer membrane lipoprotein-sorting protein
MMSYDIKRKVFLMAIMPACFFLLGWTDSWEEIRQESARVTSISARFTQSKHMKILSKPLISQGYFYFQAPDSVRWEYTSPVKSVLLMSKNGIKRYTRGSKGLVEDAGSSLPSMQIVLQEISRWSRGQFTNNEYFSAVLQGGKEPRIVLSPREKGLADMISRIVITLSPDRPGMIKSVKIFENKGNYTLFEFRDVQMNGKLSESLFREAG